MTAWRWLLGIWTALCVLVVGYSYANIPRYDMLPQTRAPYSHTEILLGFVLAFVVWFVGVATLYLIRRLTAK